MKTKLVIAGTFLMLVGFIQGMLPDLAPNRGLWISSHVSAIQNGLILVVFSAVWRGLSESLSNLAGGLLLVGHYALWIGLCIAALQGLTSPNHSTGTFAIQMVGSCALIIGYIILLWGYIRPIDLSDDR